MKIRRLKTRREKVVLIGGEGDYCESCVGFYVGGKTLSPSRGFAPKYKSSYKDAKAVEHFLYSGITLVLDESGDIRKWEDVGNSFTLTYVGSIYAPRHSAFEYLDGDTYWVAVYGGTRFVLVNDKKAIEEDMPRAQKGACRHNGRTFVADWYEPFQVRWSGIGYINWMIEAGGAGYVNLNPVRGNVYRVISMGDSLVVYREFGIDVIKAYGDARHYSVVRQSNGNVTERLNEYACAVCGETIYFCSDKNIYRYEDGKISRVKLPKCIKAKNFSTVKAYESRYVHFTCVNEDDGKPWVLEMDVTDNKFAFFAPGKKFVWGTPGGFYAWDDDMIYSESGGEMDFTPLWRSCGIDLGCDSVKTLKSIYLDCTGDVAVCVKADGTERTLNGRGKIPVNMSGINFVLEVSGRGKIDLLEGEWEVRK